MKMIFDTPAQQVELDAAIADPQPKHVWHDVPNGKWYVLTGEDIPAAPVVADEAQRNG